MNSFDATMQIKYNPGTHTTPEKTKDVTSEAKRGKFADRIYINDFGLRRFISKCARVYQ